MEKFAIYFIPVGEIYKVGSEIVGYDIKNKEITKQKYIPYGFHLTLTDVVNVTQPNLIKAISRTKIIFCLSIFKNILLKVNKIDEVPNAKITAIQYKWNWKLFLLHALLIFFVQRLGSSSDFPEKNYSFFQKMKIKHLLSPYILNDFLPHITLGENISLDVRKVFEESITINELSVVALDKKTNCFVIKSQTT